MKKLLIITCICLSIASCKDLRTEESPVQSAPTSKNENTKARNLLVGTWNFTQFLSGSVLTLKDDGSFNYHFQGCLGHKYSAGTWKLRRQGLILTSYDNYRDVPVKDVIPTSEPDPIDEPEEPTPEQKVNKRKGKPLKLITQLYTPNPSFKLVYSSPPDTTSYFERQVFLFKNDSLYFLDSQGKESEAYSREKM